MPEVPVGVVDGSVDDDPYHLDASGIREPPSGWRRSLTHLGPGLVLSASIVGSGELIATTTAGAQVGFALLWLVLLSCAVKVAVQIEFARWTIATGSPALSGCNRVPPRLGPIGWVNLLFFLLVVSKVLQVGGVLGGTAIAFSVLFPIGGDPLQDPSRTIWHAIVIALTIGSLYSNRYRLIETGAFWMVATFSIVTVVIAVGLPFTPWGYTGGEILSGLRFDLPPAALGAAMAMFGITGVGSDEIIAYNYWCIEKGYARWVGPNDGSDEWVRRARGWIAVMYKDATLSMVIYTFATVAFYVMGASVLYRQGLLPRGNGCTPTRSGPGRCGSSWWARLRCSGQRSGRPYPATRGCTPIFSRCSASSSGSTPGPASGGFVVSRSRCRSSGAFRRWCCSSLC
jgi:Mn2+/Fe2+ NRAMP family transporter